MSWADEEKWAFQDSSQQGSTSGSLECHSSSYKPGIAFAGLADLFPLQLWIELPVPLMASLLAVPVAVIHVSLLENKVRAKG